MLCHILEAKWRCPTKITAEYDKCLRTNKPELAARAFLASLAETLSLDDLRHSTDEQEPSNNTDDQEKAAAQDVLRFEYERSRDQIEHPDGSIEIRATLHNTGDAMAKRVVITLESLEPLTASEEVIGVARLNGTRLREVRRVPRLEIRANGRPPIHIVRFVRSTKRFELDAYDEQGNPRTFSFPAGRYRLTIRAIAHDGQFGGARFIVSYNEKDGLRFQKTSDRGT